MNNTQKVIRNKLGLLSLAEELKNVSQACKIMGYSRELIQPKLEEMYWFRERLQNMYRNKSIHYAKNSFDKLVTDLSLSTISVCKRLSQTLLEWKEEILNYFYSRLTNARAEGFNNKAKLIKRRAYGYRSFKNYRLRLLSACA